MIKTRPLIYILLATMPVLMAIAIVARYDYKVRYDNNLMDVRYYKDASAEFVKARVPYRDFDFAYPPFSLVSHSIPRWVAFNADLSERAYICLFLAESLLFAALMVWIVLRLIPLDQRERALRVLAVLLVIASPIWPWRYDMFPTLLTAAGFYAMMRRKPTLAGALIGLAVAAKLYPAVVLIACALWFASKAEWKSLARLTASATAAIAASTLPFLLLAPHQWMTFLEFHRARGIQIESLTGGIVQLAGALGLTPVKIVFNYGAFHLESPWAGPILQMQMPFFALLLVVCAWFLYRNFRNEANLTAPVLARGVLVMLLVFIATNKVFSTSYIIWLTPFIALVEQKLASRFILFFVMSMAIFPYLYVFLVHAEPAAIALLNARNALMLVLLGQLLSRGRQTVLAPAAQPAAV
jgi:uncharacterized membrane protein